MHVGVCVRVRVPAGDHPVRSEHLHPRQAVFEAGRSEGAGSTERPGEPGYTRTHTHTLTTSTAVSDKV